MTNYFGRTNYVSNSMLTDLDMMMKGTSFGGNMKAIFDFGNLIDALLTEPELVSYTNKTVLLHEGDVASFTDEQWYRALEMRKAGLKHPILGPIIKTFDKQTIKMIDKFDINGFGFSFSLPVRCKYDFIKEALRMGCDLKSTACTTHKSFVQSLSVLSYDRQGAWYMDLGGLDRFMFIGISKIANKKGEHDIFVHAIQKGDEMYQSGKSKYEYLATQYFLLIQ